MSDAPDGFVPVARLDELEPGVPLAVETATGVRLCVARVDGEVVAFADECSHQDFPLSAGEVLDDGTVLCPWHGARFDCRTGAVRRGPADQPIAVYDVRVADGRVLVRAEPRQAAGSQES